MHSILSKYAHLLVHYCLQIKKGDKLFLKSTTLAEDLVREVYREAIRAGATVEVELVFREKGRIFIDEAGPDQCDTPPQYPSTTTQFRANGRRPTRLDTVRSAVRIPLEVGSGARATCLRRADFLVTRHAKQSIEH